MLLTGLNPFYEIDSPREVARRLERKETAYIDPRYKTRSPSEAKIADLLPRCFEYVPFKRITIFEMVDYLNRAVHDVLPMGVSRESVLQGIETEK